MKRIVAIAIASVGVPLVTLVLSRTITTGQSDRQPIAEDVLAVDTGTAHI